MGEEDSWMGCLKWRAKTGIDAPLDERDENSMHWPPQST